MDALEDFLFRLSRQLVRVMGENLPQPWEPYVELTSKGDHVQLAAELPGIRPQDISVRVTGEGIRLSIKQDGMTVYSRAFDAGRLRHQDADIAYKNGVLQVNIPVE